LGLGELRFGNDEVTFLPALPGADLAGPAEDGWVTLFPDAPGVGTRADLRSFDAAEQRAVLRVGWCLECHEGGDWIFDGPSFPATVRRGRGGACPAPRPRWTP
jgi:hypothetical protein